MGCLPKYKNLELQASTMMPKKENKMRLETISRQTLIAAGTPAAQKGKLKTVTETILKRNSKKLLTMRSAAQAVLSLRPWSAPLPTGPCRDSETSERIENDLIRVNTDYVAQLTQLKEQREDLLGDFEQREELLTELSTFNGSKDGKLPRVSRNSSFLSC